VAVAAAAFVRGLLARTRIGVDVEHVSGDTIVVRAVAVRGTQVQWKHEARLDPQRPLPDALISFLRALPCRRWPRPDVIVALGSESVQLKRLPGLPPLSDPRALTAAVRENASRFFLRNGIPIATSALRIDGPGEAWGAAVERPLLGSIETACHSARLRLRAIVPAAAVVGSVLNPGPRPLKRDRPAPAGVPRGTPAGATPAASNGAITIVWPRSDAPTAQALTFADRRLVGLRRLRHSAGEITSDAAGGSATSALGVESWPFAAAYGAAVFGYREPIAWRPTAREHTQVSTTQVHLAALSCALAVIAAVVSPGLAATFAASRATHHLHVVTTRRQDALRGADSLAQVTTALREAAAFSDRRHSVTVLLAELARVLPPRSALVAFHIDSSGGTLVALTPDASALLANIEHLPGIAAPELVGPVTSEPIQSVAAVNPPTPPQPASLRTLDRVTVRFRVAATSADSRATRGFPLERNER